MLNKCELNTFVENLEAGEVVAAPAEGVYGYCVDPFNEKALQKLVKLKGRTPSKGFITLISNIEQLAELTSGLSKSDCALIREYWPGQVTLIFPAANNLPHLLTGGEKTIAVRLPQKDYMQEYLHRWGRPLVSTSANISGEAPATRAAEVLADIYILPNPSPLDGSTSVLVDSKTKKKLRS